MARNLKEKERHQVCRPSRFPTSPGAGKQNGPNSGSAQLGFVVPPSTVIFWFPTDTAPTGNPSQWASGCWAGPPGGGHDTSLLMASSKCLSDDAAPSGMVPQFHRPGWSRVCLAMSRVGVLTPKQLSPLTSSEPLGTEFIHPSNIH